MNEGTFPNYINLATYQTIQKGEVKKCYGMERKTTLPTTQGSRFFSNSIKALNFYHITLHIEDLRSHVTMSHFINAIKFNQLPPD
jgi:hypothetical protein